MNAYNNMINTNNNTMNNNMMNNQQHKWTPTIVLVPQFFINEQDKNQENTMNTCN
jgi:hypothetical protein